MAVYLARRWRGRPPPSGSARNHAHPIWGLGSGIGLWNFGDSSLRNLLTNRFVTLTAGAQRKSSFIGMAGDGSGSGLVTLETLTLSLGTADFWCATSFDFRGYTDAGSSLNTLLNYGISNLNSDFEITTDSTNVLRCGISQAYPSSTVTSGAIKLNTPHTLVVARRGNSSFMWLDGIAVANSGSCGTVNDSSAQMAALNDIASGAREWRGVMFSLAMGFGTITDQIALDVSESMFPLFRQRVQRRYMAMPAAGGTFKAAWNSAANSVISSGARAA